MARNRILVVDDDAQILRMTQAVLEGKGFEVVSAANVTEALQQIVTRTFDVLVTDLQMPNPGDGFAVVTAMRHSQPKALTIVVSGFPDVEGAMAAILLQADEILVKPVEFKRLAELINNKLNAGEPAPKLAKQSVANILERDATVTIERWLARVGQVKELNSILLTNEERTHHLSEIMRNIVSRLRKTRDMEAIASHSPAAVAHGEDRYRQGYSASLIVQESRILQVCIFETIQRNLATVDFSLVLPDIMLIADEVDAQLSQCIEGFLNMRSEMVA